VTLFRKDPSRWESIRTAARNARFTWSASAKKYLELIDPS
jgi:hypothetical protein